MTEHSAVTHGTLVREGMRRLRETGSGAPEYEAREMYFSLSGFTLGRWLLAENEPADSRLAEQYRSYIRRRADGEPLQYITGRAPFYGRDFIVRPGVLIPRYDTETLVCAALPRLREGMRILDLCTGSGCILLTLLMEGPGGPRGTGSDISEESLAVAEANGARFAEEIREKGSTAEFTVCDLYGDLSGTYDIICSNPPYIREADLSGLDAEVRCFEPRAALSGGEDGLHFYREICRGAPGRLTDGGILACEIGCDQAEAVLAVFHENGFGETEVFRDPGGRDRVVSGVFRRPERDAVR